MASAEVEAPIGTDILIVDDTSANVIAIRAALSDLGYGLVEATSGREALRLLLDRDFALILLDVQMPGMDGFETARLIRARRRSEETPIIFVTAFSRDDREVLQGYELGAIDFLFKPIVPEVLRTKVTVLVELNRRKEEARQQAERIRDLERAEARVRLAEERQRWEAERLRDENRRKDEFLAVLAHELRNPLAPLWSCLEVIERRNVEQVSDMLVPMRRQLHHLVVLVDDLLDVARVSQGKINLERKLLHLEEVVSQAVEAQASNLAQRDHTWTQVCHSDVVVDGDDVRLSQIVQNLVSNAARYTPPGGNVRIEAGAEGDRAYVRVTDNGQGIAPDRLADIFELFVQERGVGQGLGLGLTLVRQLAELHGGSVEAHSNGIDQGSTFTVWLPLADGQPLPVEPTAEESPMPPLRVLIVDDNADIRMGTSMLLRTWGHEVFEAPDGATGVALATSERPDVALVDIGMPGMNGFQVARAIHQAMGEDRPRLVAVTGYSDEASSQKIVESGFDAHVVKSSETSALRSALRS